MSDVEKWILASAYELAGMERTADQLLLRATTRVESYAEFGGTYGSGLRDLAMILDSATTLRRWEVGDGLYEEIASESDLCLDMDLEPGTIQLLSNHTILHARTGYDDQAEPERKRHLLRLWLSIK